MRNEPTHYRSRLRQSAIGAFCLFALAACKPSVNVELGLSEILSETNPKTVNAVFHVPLSDEAECARSWDALAPVLQDYLGEAEATFCGTEIDGQTRLRIRAKLPVVSDAATWLLTGANVLGITLQGNEQRVQVDVLYNQNAMRKLVLDLTAHFGTPVEFETPDLALTLEQEGSIVGAAQLSGALVNGEPAIQFQQFLVLAGRPVRVDVGSVKLAYLQRNGHVPVVQVLRLDALGIEGENSTDL